MPLRSLLLRAVTAAGSRSIGPEMSQGAGEAFRKRRSEDDEGTRDPEQYQCKPHDVVGFLWRNDSGK